MWPAQAAVVEALSVVEPFLLDLLHPPHSLHGHRQMESCQDLSQVEQTVTGCCEDYSAVGRGILLHAFVQVVLAV